MSSQPVSDKSEDSAGQSTTRRVADSVCSEGQSRKSKGRGGNRGGSRKEGNVDASARGGGQSRGSGGRGDSGGRGGEIGKRVDAAIGVGRGEGGGRGGKNENTIEKQNQQQIDKKDSPRPQDTGNESEKQPQSASSKVNRSRNQKGRQQQQKNKNVAKNDSAKEEVESDEQINLREQEKRDKEAAILLKLQQEESMKKAAARQKEKDERETSLKEARDMLRTTLDCCQQHAVNRTALEPENLEIARKNFESSKKQLKTDLKKCTAFVKKVKSGAVWSMKVSDIQQDIATLNLSRYVEEVVQALTETSIKVTDLPIFTALSLAMHQRYAEFLPSLLPAIWSVVTTASSETVKLRRLYVRLLTEFLLNGLIQAKDVKQFIKCITEWTGANSGYAVQDVNLLVAFARSAGFEVFGVTPASIASSMNLVENEINMSQQSQKSTPDQEESDENILKLEGPVQLSESLVSEAIEVHQKLHIILNEQRAVSSDVSEIILKHFLGAFATLTTSLTQTHRKLQKLEKRCEQDRLLSGSLTENREKGLKDARMLSDSLVKSVEALSDCLRQPIPILEDEEDEENSNSGVGVEVWTKGGDGVVGGEDFGPFDDEETRNFYCDIPDLLATFPPALLGLSAEDIEKQKMENARKYGSDSANDSVEDDRIEEISSFSEARLEAEEEEEARLETQQEMDAKEDGKGEKETMDTPHYRLTMLLEQELPECHRREQIDAIVEKFCSTHGSSKNSRKRLLKTLFLVPHRRLDLLPYYSRMAATVDRIWTDISSTLVSDLEQQFHGQAKFKKNQNIDSRMKTARYVGELTKFRVAPPIVVLRCLQRCIEDFTGNNVDVACCLLESCGRYLYRTKHANSRLVTLMDTMTRLSKAKNLDDRLQSLLKAAYYSVKPPPSGPKRKAKEYPPLEAYLRHLLLERLEPTDASIMLASKQLLRLPWNDPAQDCGAVVCRIMLKACRKGRYKTIEAIAVVAAKLRSQRAAGEATIRLIDTVIEEIRWALENPNFRDQQRIVTYARLLGELHCASLISGQVVIDQLYDFINLGHEIPDILREASKQMAAENSKDSGCNSSIEKVEVYYSAGGVNRAIHEDEELDDLELETKKDIVSTQQQPVAVSLYSTYDPRVPSAIDPPTSCYRITLVCSLLEQVAKSLVSRSSSPRLQAFMTAFQRYLFTKSALPTDVEFALLDTFDVLDSHWKRLYKGLPRGSSGATQETGFKRFPSWLEAHNATVANEEAEAIFEMQKRARLETISDESKAMSENNETIEGQSLQDEDSILDDDDDVDDDDDDDTLSVSARDSTDGQDDEGEHEGEHELEHENENAQDEENDQSIGIDGETDDDRETDDDDADEEEFDEEAYIRQMEEDAFERELRRITMDALEKGKNASRKQVGESMIAGSQVVKKKEIFKSAEPSNFPPVGIALGGKVGITFQLLKKGNKGKVEAKELLVPADTNLALVLTKQDDAAARERDEIKQRVLRYEAESAEAEYSGGNVYLEQEKLQFIRNRPLSMDEIDRNFGTSGGNLRQTQADAAKPPQSNMEGRGRMSRGTIGRGRGAGRGRGGRINTSGRTLFS